MTEKPIDPERLSLPNWFPLFWVLALGFFIFILLRNAWICDDSLITMRSIDNLVHGLGFGYNAGERVQSFTHPLWALLITPIYALTNEAYFTLLVPGILLTLAAVIMISLTTRSLHLGIICLLAITFSKAFMDYSTSGLENPLTHLFLVIFFLQSQKLYKPPLFVLALIAGLATFTRMDTLIFYLPYLLRELYQSEERFKTLLVILSGFLPFLAWEVFSLVYYGFPFPNTAYSKLNVGIEKMDLWRQGLLYFIESFKMDPITPLLTALGIFSVLFRGRRNLWPFAVGILLYMIYTINVGGDFMAGRWLTGPFLLSILLLSRLEVKLRYCLPVLILVAIISLMKAESPIYCDGEYFMDKEKKARKDLTVPLSGVVDEKIFYYENLGLFSKKRVKNLVSPWKDQKMPEKVKAEFYRVAYGVGYWGFLKGATYHYVDYYALVDPLLARLPCKDSKGWRIGHFHRLIPQGYIQSLRSETNLIQDRELSQFYNKMKLIVSGKIWTGERFKTILQMNLGHFDHLIIQERWQDVVEYRDLATSPELRSAKKARYPSKGFDTMLINPDKGLTVDLMYPRSDTLMNLSLNHNSKFEISVMSGARKLVRYEVGPTDSLNAGMAVYDIHLPDSVSRTTFDFVQIMPVSGEKDCSIGHLILK